MLPEPNRAFPIHEVKYDFFAKQLGLTRSSCLDAQAIIKQQSVSDARRDYLWHWMVEDQGMVQPDEETKELILTYLKRHFSSEN